MKGKKFKKILLSILLLLVNFNNIVPIHAQEVLNNDGNQLINVEKTSQDKREIEWKVTFNQANVENSGSDIKIIPSEGLTILSIDMEDTVEENGIYRLSTLEGDETHILHVKTIVEDTNIKTVDLIANLLIEGHEFMALASTEYFEVDEMPKVEQVKMTNKEDESFSEKTEKVTEETEKKDKSEEPKLVEEKIEEVEVKRDEKEMEGVQYDKKNDPDIILPSSKKYQPMSSITDTIEVDKTAIRTTGCRVFEVSLDITGTPQQAPVDVVLVIDRSGSMNELVGGWNSQTRLYYAKEAAVNFANRVLGSNGIPGSRVSIVSFSGPTTTSGNGHQNQASTDLDLSSDLNTVTNTINGITAVGGTNTEAGFLEGKSVIQGGVSNQNPNSNKVVIMFTDGLPTASNGNIYEESLNINHVHNQRAISSGQSIHSIADVYSIGLVTGMSNTETNLASAILTAASNKTYYPAPSATDLDAIFTEISQSLGYAATNAKVVDKIGDNFDLIVSSLPTGASYNSTTREITWEPGTITHSAQLKYNVVAKGNFPGGMADTNKFATLTYKDVFGAAGKTKTFPVPKVDVPTLIEISLTDANIDQGDSISLGSGMVSSGENYMSPVTGGDNDGITFTYEWRKVGSNTVISTDKNPTVSPTEDTQYEVTVTDSNGCIAVAEMKVTVKQFTEFTVTKVWQGGSTLIRPTVQFQLYRNIDGEPAVPHGAAETLSGTTHTWDNLELKNEDGNTYIYSFEELDVENYEASYDGNEVTNTYKIPETGEFTAEKIWDGGSAEARPEVKFQLYKNISGQELVAVGSPETLEGLSHTWSDLEVTDQEGNAYIYSFRELDVDNYVASYDGNTVTNTYKSPTTGKFTAKKIWNGGSSLERPEVQFQLYRESAEETRVAVDGPETLEGSSYTWTGLAITDQNGNPYTYSFEELDVENYEASYDGNTVTNTYVSPTTGQYTATKNWIGGSANDRPEVRFQLYRNISGEDPVAYRGEEVLSGLTHTWNNLELTDEEGNDYIYSFQELTLENYTPTYSEDGSMVTNTNNELINIPVEKVWVGPKAESITITLYKGEGEDKVSVGEPMVLNGTETNPWKDSFKDLRKYDSETGEEIIYSVEETAIVDYTTVISGTAAGFTVTNTNDELINIPVEKVWVGPKAESITITLYKDEGGDKVSVGDPMVLDGTETNPWKDSFKDLRKYDSETGEEIIYSVEETAISDYTTVISGTAAGFTVTNTNTETIDLMVEKKWIGSEGDEVLVQLYKDGIAVSPDKKAVLNELNNWTYEFTGLQKYNLSTDEPYDYTVVEIKVTDGSEVLENQDIDLGYDVIYSEIVNGKITITNMYKYGSLNITKKGDDGELLEDAVFKLTSDINGVYVVADNITTDDLGSALVTGLKRGTYYLHETKAPEGHRLLTSPIEVTIGIENLDVELPVINTESGWVLPATGGVGPVLFYASGSLLMIFALLVLKKKKDENNV